MTGFPGYRDLFYEGWYEINTEGIATLYISIADEGIVTLSTDTPANKVYKARLLNPNEFSIRREPIVWPHGDTSIQLAAIGSLKIDNEDGLYAFLVGADLRDATVVIKLTPAMAFGSATMVSDSPTVATAILDDVSSNETTITITLRDTLARLDKPLPVRYNPPFVDSGAANRMVPISLGAVRNIAPLLIDAPNRIYQLGDMPMSNVSAARVGAANLDPNATPPDYVPALSGSGLQLATEAKNKLTVDCSTAGAQVVIPGSDDVLEGIGEFDDWDSGGAPVGWDWSDNPGSLLRQVGPPDYPAPMAELSSSRIFLPSISRYGDWLVTEDNVLKGGKAYRMTAKIFSTVAPAVPPEGVTGGFIFRSALSANPADSISGDQPITVRFAGNQSYVFEFRCPPGADRPLYIIICTSRVGLTAVGDAFGFVYDVKLEELGEYLELPVRGIQLNSFFFEWLVNRAGEEDTIYSSSDLLAIDNATEYEFGYHVTEQPNILDGLRSVCDSFCATLFTDHDGKIRAKRLIDPKDADPIAVFDSTNILRPIQVDADPASNLTTLIGTTRNYNPLTDSDFVTDFDTVPADVRTRYKRVSQYQRTSSKTPAGQYSFAIGAPVFDSLLDSADDGQTEIDRVVGIFSPRVYDDGTVSTGKRRRVTFTAYWDDLSKLGSTLQCDVRDILYGTVVTLNYPEQGFDNTAVEVIGWEIFPFDQRITILGFF
jgi:hypothetical protein